MRQTLVKEGLQLRLPDLLGNDSAYNNAFSIQSSMLEDMNRICRALVGNSPYGRVMGGLGIDASDGQVIKVNPGYGITRAGKIIKISRPFSSSTVSPNTTYNVYLNYIEEERGNISGNDQGGFSAPVTRTFSTVSIIKDQCGTTTLSSDVPSSGSIVTIDSGSGIVGTDDNVYVGTVTFGANTSTGTIIVYPKAENNDSNYIYKDVVTSTLLSTGALVATGFQAGSEIVLAEGSNYLRSISLVLRGKTTAVQRATSDPSNYLINFQVQGVNSNGNKTLFTGIVLQDSINDYSFQNYIINQPIDSSYHGLALYPTVTTPTNAFQNTTAVQCSVSYVIEKLT